MFNKKQDSNITYFIGGTAVGVAAGLVVGKLFSSISPVKTQNCKPTTSTSKSVNGFSQEDDKCNLYFNNAKQCTITPSKSASTHESRSATKKSVPETSFKTFYNYSINNINNLASGEGHNTKLEKLSYDKNKLHNISIEDNANCNFIDESTVRNSRGKDKCINNYFSEYKSIKKQNCITHVENNNCTNAEVGNCFKNISTKDMNTLGKKDTFSKIPKDNGLPEIYNNLSNNFDDYESTTNIIENYVENASHVATCNSTLHFEDEEEEKALHSTFMDDFCETDLISSTKHNLEGT